MHYRCRLGRWHWYEGKDSDALTLFNKGGKMICGKYYNVANAGLFIEKLKAARFKYIFHVDFKGNRKDAKDGVRAGKTLALIHEELEMLARQIEGLPRLLIRGWQGGCCGGGVISIRYIRESV